MFAIWWDDRLGPSLGRSYPPIELSEEEVLNIFMSHGLNSKTSIGYTRISDGLVISYIHKPNCIAVLLDDDDDLEIIERNLMRLVPHIDLASDNWDAEIKQAFDTLNDLIKETTGTNLLTHSDVKEFIRALKSGHIRVIVPEQVLKGVIHYAEAEPYFGNNPDEVVRVLKDLEREKVLVAKTYGRKIECRQCGSDSIRIELRCPKCGSDDIHSIYTVFCPKCSNQFQTVLIDGLTEVRCQKCQEAVKVADLAATNVELLCNSCGMAFEEPRIVLICSVCNHTFSALDLLAGTSVAYHPSDKYQGSAP